MNAGTNQSEQKDSAANITLTGTVIDPGSAPIVSTLWEVVSKPPASTPVINTPASLITTVGDVIENVGEYVFKLTGTNGDSGVGTDFVYIEITAIPIPPIEVDAGPDQLLPLVPNPQIQLAGVIIENGTTPVDTILWEILQQPGASNLTFDQDDILNPLTSVAVVAGLYIFKITITNPSLESDSDTIEVFLGTPPVVDAGLPAIITLPDDEAFLTGTATDSDGSVVSTLWTKVLGPAGGNIVSPNTLSTIIDLLLEGSYLFKLTATDNDGFTGEDTVNVTVSPAIVPSSLIISSSIPDIDGDGTLDFFGGEPFEVITLDFDLSNISGGSSISFGAGVVVGPLDTLHQSQTGTATLNGSGELSSPYSIEGNLRCAVQITARSSGLLIPNTDTTYIENN